MDDNLKQKLLIFDLDGTLIDSRQDLCTGVNLMRRHYHLPPLPVKTISAFVGNGIRNLVERSLEGQSIDIDEAVRIDYKFYLRHIHDKTVLYPGVDRGLKALVRHGHDLALISNKNTEACKIILTHFKLLDLFASVIGGDSGLPLKPEPDTILATMRATKSNVENTWIIGDNHTDLAAARNAGVKSVFVTYGIGRAGGEKPSLSFDKFTSLVRYFIG